MKAERARLARLHRLERIRAIASQAALAESGRAESRLAQLRALGARTAALGADYAGRRDAATGDDLRQLAQFSEGIDRIAKANAADIERARALADTRAAEAAAAERRRAAVEERAGAQARAIARKLVNSAHPAAGKPARSGDEDEPS